MGWGVGWGVGWVWGVGCGCGVGCVGVCVVCGCGVGCVMFNPEVRSLMSTPVHHSQMKKPSILKKYDEEIEGETKRSFALGEWLYECHLVTYIVW